MYCRVNEGSALQCVIFLTDQRGGHVVNVLYFT